MNWFDSVNQHMTVDEVLLRFPQTAELFQELGVRETCRDCALAAIAHRIRMEPQELVARINQFLTLGEESGRTL